MSYGVASGCLLQFRREGSDNFFEARVLLVTDLRPTRPPLQEAAEDVFGEAPKSVPDWRCSIVEALKRSSGEEKVHFRQQPKRQASSLRSRRKGVSF